MLRSGMTGWFTIMLDSDAWTAARGGKQEVDIHRKKLRPLIRDANLYHITPRSDGIHWDGIEYWNPEQEHGVVYTFDWQQYARKEALLRSKGTESIRAVPP